MILTGREINDCVRDGTISITPYDWSNMGPNSYNLHLSPRLLVYNSAEHNFLRLTHPNPTTEIIMQKSGFVMNPGTLYLGQTIERTKTNHYVPMLEGRSSFARLGISVHASAGFGDIGFDGHWTLEITCTHRVLMLPGIAIAQIFYVKTNWQYADKYAGKYQKNDGVQPSFIHREIKR